MCGLCYPGWQEARALFAQLGDAAREAEVDQLLIVDRQACFPDR
jgi:hypothetical protein